MTPEIERQIRVLLDQGPGHLCFDCRRVLERGDVISITFMGPLGIYHHAACIYPEEKVQALAYATMEGEMHHE